MTTDDRKEVKGALITAAVVLLIAALAVTFMPVCGKPEPTPAPADYSAQLTSIAESLKAIAKREHSVVKPTKPCRGGKK